MKVESSSALGTLTVTTKDLESDAALKLVVTLANSLQLTLKEQKKGTLSLELPSGSVLSQRNAILRFLSGMGLHNALDDALCGGHSKAKSASPFHAMALASLSSWMSVADHYRKSKDGITTELLLQLETHLETRAFLIPSATPTLADVDMASVVLAKCGATFADSVVGIYTNVHRWLLTVGGLLTKHGVNCDITTKVPAIANSHGPPTFYFGNEEGVELPVKQKKKKAGATPPADKGKGGDKGGKPAAAEGKKGKNKGGGGGGGKKQQPQAASFTISALDIRVGKILKAWPHPEAEKLYCEEIDVGEETPRQIASGLRPFYASAEDLTGKTVMVLCNLKKRNLVGFPSHGMVMCASNADHTSVETMEPPAGATIGERITFEGFEGDAEPENKVAKKKIFESIAPELKTNAEGICVWKDAVSKTSGGPVKASKGMAGAQVA